MQQESNTTKLPQDMLDAIEREARRVIIAAEVDDSIAGVDYTEFDNAISPEVALELCRVYRMTIQSEGADIPELTERHPDVREIFEVIASLERYIGMLDPGSDSYKYIAAIKVQLNLTAMRLSEELRTKQASGRIAITTQMIIRACDAYCGVDRAKGGHHSFCCGGRIRETQDDMERALEAAING